MTKDEALKLALVALERTIETMEWVGGENDCSKGIAVAEKAITAIKEALKQPEQHQDWCASLTQMLASMPPKPAPCNCKPEPVIDKSAAVRIATALGWEPKRKPLTDEEIGKILDDPNIAEKHQGNWLVLPYAFARAIEATHGIKE